METDNHYLFTRVDPRPYEGNSFVPQGDIGATLLLQHY